MKTIGILGGASWAASALAYEKINLEVARRLGAHHSARIILYSIDYAPIKDLYHHGWDKLPRLLQNEVEFILSRQPNCFFIACNTLHKGFDLIEKNLLISVPFFHAVKLTQQALKKKGVKKALFMGTSFTMSDDYFMGPLKQDGTTLVLPTEEEQEKIQLFQAALARGTKEPTMVIFFKKLLLSYHAQGCSCVILACTELPLIIDAEISPMMIIDPLQLQCEAAVSFALEDLPSQA